MTRKEAISKIEEITGERLANMKYYRLDQVLRELEKVKIIYRDRVLYNDAQYVEYIDYDREANRIAKLYDLTIKDLKGKRRLFKDVQARVHLCRYIRKKYANSTSVGLARYLNRHHSTVLHYLHHYKGGCPIDSIPVNEYVND